VAEASSEKRGGCICEQGKEFYGGNVIVALGKWNDSDLLGIQAQEIRHSTSDFRPW
jgi:hypothetical protein